MTIASRGASMAVDWEQRVDFPRLRAYRLGRARAAPMRGAMPDATGVPDSVADLVYEELRERGLEQEPLGLDVPDMTTLLALQRKGLQLVDSQPVMLEARRIKS